MPHAKAFSNYISTDSTCMVCHIAPLNGFVCECEQTEYVPTSSSATGNSILTHHCIPFSFVFKMLHSLVAILPVSYTVYAEYAHICYYQNVHSRTLKLRSQSLCMFML